jgi:hypothetical protein
MKKDKHEDHKHKKDKKSRDMTAEEVAQDAPNVPKPEQPAV